MRSDKDYRLNRTLLERARELRQPQTPAEQKLWLRLCNQQIGFKFRRQHPIDRFILDFYCATTHLVVEVDGDTHAEQADYDAARTEWLEQRGYYVIRFSNTEVHGQLDAVLEAIQAECQRLADIR